MIAAVDTWLGIVPPSRDKDIDRLLLLMELLEQYGFNGDYVQVMNWHNTYQVHGVYPFGRGTWEDQPEWLLQDFRTLELKQEVVDLQKKLDEKPKEA